MNYELVELKEMMVGGLLARTNNSAPDMGNVIIGLWDQFMGIYPSVMYKVNEKTLGIYTEYEGRETEDYSVLAACEVEKKEGQPNGITIKIIPGGTYAKFIAEGEGKEAVAKVWQQLWNMNLPRSFICDFEEYERIEEGNVRVHVYVGLKK